MRRMDILTIFQIALLAASSLVFPAVAAEIRTISSPATGHKLTSEGSIIGVLQRLLESPEDETVIHLVAVLNRLGISEEAKAKTVLRASPALSMQGIANGEAELYFGLTDTILNGQGVEFVGPYQSAQQHRLLVSAGIGTRAAAPDLIGFLTSTEAASVFRAKGLEPGVP